jgi:alcohol dehydrogenase, propanol-preferring
MRAMVLRAAGLSLEPQQVPLPEPARGQVRVRVEACAVCRTDLHIVDGELHEPKLPLIVGHQIVGVVDELGADVHGLERGQRVGIPWLGWTDGVCRYCRSGRENLCDNALLTGYQLDGGFAEAAVAGGRYCFPLPVGYPFRQAAPLLCGGLIGYRALRFAGDAERLGLYGFGSAAH